VCSISTGVRQLGDSWKYCENKPVQCNAQWISVRYYIFTFYESLLHKILIGDLIGGIINRTTFNHTDH